MVKRLPKSAMKTLTDELIVDILKLQLVYSYKIRLNPLTKGCNL